MGVVALDDDGASSGEGRCGVPACDGEGEGEVGGAEDGDRSERDGALADVRPRCRGAVGESGVDDRGVPGAFAQHRGEQTELAGRAPNLAGDAGGGEAGLGGGARNDPVLGGLDVGGDGVEELGALL